MNDVHAKVAAWYQLYAAKKDYESRVRQVEEQHGGGDDGMRVRLEAEMKTVAAQVDRAFREASDAVHGKPGHDRPSAH